MSLMRPPRVRRRAVTVPPPGPSRPRPRSARVVSRCWLGGQPRLRSSAARVVVRAPQPPVVLRGGAALGVRDDVVDLATVGGDPTAGEGAVPVAQLDGP